MLAVLRGHLPHSNAIYNRIIAPQNEGRHCIVASSITSTPESFIMLFADRSRSSESQCWIYHSHQNLDLIPNAQFGDRHRDEIRRSLKEALVYLNDKEVPDAPGWPFTSELRFAMIHERVYEQLSLIAASAITYTSTWLQYCFKLSDIECLSQIPDKYTLSRVPADQLDLVLSTSLIPRQAATMLTLPSAALLEHHGSLISWAYIGIDGSFATLYTVPEYRGRGLGTFVVTTLLTQLRDGKFSDLGFHGQTGWTQSDVAQSNTKSNKLMRRLGGDTRWSSVYCRLDLALLHNHD